MRSLKSTTTETIEAHQAGWQAFMNGDGRDTCSLYRVTRIAGPTATEIGSWQNGWDQAHMAAIIACRLEEHRLDIATQLDAGETMAREVLRAQKVSIHLKTLARQTIKGAHRLKAVLMEGDVGV